jgi:hypothetical protein
MITAILNLIAGWLFALADLLIPVGLLAWLL